MSLRPFAVHRLDRLAAGPVAAAAMGALLAAGCTAGAVAPPTPTIGPAGSVPVVASPTPDPVTPSPTTPERSTGEPPATASTTPRPDAPSAPPSALLADADEVPVAGTLGSYTWGNGGSDSPWIIVGVDRAATGTGPWTMSFEPEVPVESWVAAWAAIRDGRPGRVEGYEQGATGPIMLTGPTGPGPWTLKVEVRVVGGGSAVYFWRLKPAG
jgi:hypothetical protein